MHEYSIVESLLEQVKLHTPAGRKLLNVIVEAGPLQGIDSEIMQQAWKILTEGTALNSAILEIHQLPWTLHCPACQRQWTSTDFPDTCTCGNASPNPIGGRDLRLDSLIVDDPTDEDPSATKS